MPLPPRSIEDIKARYYSIVKKLKPQMLPEHMVLDEVSGANAFRRVQGYDPEYDRQRKAKMAAYYGRSTKQEQIDNKTLEEAKAIENSVWPIIPCGFEHNLLRGILRRRGSAAQAPGT